ncbi:MAG: Rrf2 family transcriptional regulator [Armatimonadetes bacterium]|nr:Rrf2 family transcriptional regulator [Armatimonadota bacterium]MDE2207425.1 Rrf2 family transcriptional regulator [Armatimonadota bacterium]
MISQTAEYALRAVVHLAQFSDSPQTTEQIGAATQMPRPYLAKVLNALAKARVVRAQRGMHGGFALVRPANALSIYEVVQAVDPLHRILECPLGLPAHAEQLCPLHRSIDEVLELMEQRFRSIVIADILQDPAGIMPLRPNPSQAEQKTG